MVNACVRNCTTGWTTSSNGPSPGATGSDANAGATVSRTTAVERTDLPQSMPRSACGDVVL